MPIFDDGYLIRNHYYLGTRNAGPSRKLTGKIAIIHILLNDPMSSWVYPGHVTEYEKAVTSMSAKLMAAAALAGTRITIQSVYCQANLPMIADASGNWVSLLFRSLGYADAGEMQRAYELKTGCDEAPIMIALNRPMRSFAAIRNDRSLARGDEFSVVFRHTLGTFDPIVLGHELLHQFGAVDYYYPDITVQAARRYFPRSIMFENGPEVDDLTRYLIGWKDTLTPTAMAFLRDTASVNDAVILAAKLRGV